MRGCCSFYQKSQELNCILLSLLKLLESNLQKIASSTQWNFEAISTTLVKQSVCHGMMDFMLKLSAASNFLCDSFFLHAHSLPYSLMADPILQNN